MILFFVVMPANVLGTLGKFGSGHARVAMPSLGLKFVLQFGIRLWQNHEIQKVCECGSESYHKCLILSLSNAWPYFS